MYVVSVERDLPRHSCYEDAVTLGRVVWRFTTQNRDAMMHDKYDRLTAQQEEEGS